MNENNFEQKQGNFKRINDFRSQFCWYLTLLAAASLIFLIEFPKSIELTRELKTLLFLAIMAILFSLCLAFFWNIVYKSFLEAKGAQFGKLRNLAHKILYIFMITSAILYILGIALAVYISILIFDLFPFAIFLKT